MSVRQEPEGITLVDPKFDPLPGARADYGRLAGAVYRIEMPEHWNGRLVLFMHGFDDLKPQAAVSDPKFRTYLILHRYAWGASSFSSTSLIPGRAADETAALWDFFVQKYGRPIRTYVTGQSMGGAATQIAAERDRDRFDGALAFCGNNGNDQSVSGGSDYVAAGAYVAGVTQAEYDATTDVFALVRDRILPALRDPAADERFESLALDLSGGPRAYDRDGFRIEKETNWRRDTILLAAGLVSNRDRTYQFGPTSGVSSDEFNRAVVRFKTNEEALRAFLDGNETTGNLQIPFLSMHTTGDGEVPLEQTRILQQRVDAAGKSNLLVQRVVADASHCGFTVGEMVAGFEALVGWVERGNRPDGDDVMVNDMRALGTRYQSLPRDGSAGAETVPGARERVTFSGQLTLDGAPFDSPDVGAVVLRDGLATPCQYSLASVANGRYQITVQADAESGGCGAPSARVLVWTVAGGKILHSTESELWPVDARSAAFDTSFSLARPDGAMPPVTDFNGEVFDRNGDIMPAGVRIEAFVGDVRCGIASTRRVGNFDGYILSVVGPGSKDGCVRNATLTFRVGGEPAVETAVNSLAAEDVGSLDLIQR